MRNQSTLSLRYYSNAKKKKQKKNITIIIKIIIIIIIIIIIGLTVLTENRTDEMKEGKKGTIKEEVILETLAFLFVF